MTVLQTVQHSYKKMEIQDVSYTWSEYNIADAWTKIEKHSILIHVIENSNFDHPVQQRIIRTSKSDLVIKRREC